MMYKTKHTVVAMLPLHVAYDTLQESVRIEYRHILEVKLQS
jgi:hypothetical protein